MSNACSGVYALYYSGDFEGYAAISGKEHPIYVGKADPRDPTSQTAMDQGDRLSRRQPDLVRSEPVTRQARPMRRLLMRRTIRDARSPISPLRLLSFGDTLTADTFRLGT